MAKWEDYKHLQNPQEEVDQEINEAAQQQEDREESTLDVNWEKRYKDLEVAFSRQGQQIGEYRKLVDDYLTTTPDANESQEVSPITQDEILDTPDEAVRRAVDSHPAIQRVQELEEELAQSKRDAAMEALRGKHPEYDDYLKTPEFANWVQSDGLRVELAQRADGYDMAAADALFSLWEAENAQPPAREQDVSTVSLESGSGAEPPAPDRYSRAEMLKVMTRAKQGDIQAQDYWKAHSQSYIQALQAGNVRD